jgi:tRNA(adenine34) deaminase
MSVVRSTSDSDPEREQLADQAMARALELARLAVTRDEVPVGAVILREGQVIATGYNRPITTHDPTAHAEIVALRQAAQLRENNRLPECELYVTLVPSAMCAMARLHARQKRVVFGAADPKTGAAGSVVNLFALPALNHHTQLHGGVMAADCGQQLREFFAERRSQQRSAQQADPGLPATPPDAAQEAIPTGEAVELTPGTSVE